MHANLNAKQLEAVETTEGPVLILAGAGSGKTRVLIHRIAHLIKTEKAKPWNIFAVTFTNKAAGEMKARLDKIFGENVSHSLWVATFHSACVRILKAKASLLGYHAPFTIYDDKDQLIVIDEVLEELKINTKLFPAKSVAMRINQAKNQGIFADQYKRNFDDYYGEKVGLIYEAYQKKLLVNQAMDFGDLILNTLLLFQKFPEVLEFYQNQFQYIHVDEYQDTNRSQYQLVSLLSQKSRNLCVVGDDDQSIYKFRGAEIKNILDFKKDFPEAKVIRLEQNYRSTSIILKAASSVVANNQGRMGKTLWTENTEGEPITLFCGLTDKDEAGFVVSEIEKNRLHYQLDQMALLYRTHAQSRALEDELRRHSIPYSIIGGLKFYDRKEIKDILAYLKVMVNPSDQVALFRIINEPGRGIGKTTLQKISEKAALQQKSAWDVLIQMISENDSSLVSKSTLQKITQFVLTIKNLHDQVQRLPLIELMAQVFDLTGYWKMLEAENTIEAQSRMENLKELVNVVGDYVQNKEEPTLAGFLDEMMLSSDADRLDPTAAKLPLMTFHLAKGLEFPVVFLVGMEEGVFPHSRSLSSDEELEEERRLCYVGMTRAEKKLYLSFVRSRQLFGKTEYHAPSRFLDEIPKDLVTQVGQSPFKKTWDETSQDQNDDYSQDFPSYDSDPDCSDTLQPAPTLQKGTRIKHPQFGVGTILNLEGTSENRKLTIRFNTGQTKQILAKYAAMDIL